MARAAVAEEAHSSVSLLDQLKAVDLRLYVPCCSVRVVRRAGSLADADDNPAAHHDFPIVDLYEILLVHMSAKWHGHRPKLPDHSDNHHTHSPGSSSLAPGLSSRMRGQDAPGHVVVGGDSERPAVDNKPLLLRVRLIVSLLRIFCRFYSFPDLTTVNFNLYLESWRRIPRSMLPIDA
jgi:hypothetical protein